MSNRSDNRKDGFTGRHMLFLMLGFFGVIIAVNLTMAGFASRSWSGFVVRNSYVASQQFNEKAREGREQAALGWSGRLAVAAGEVRYVLLDRSGGIVPARQVRAYFRRPASVGDDRQISLEAGRSGWRGSAPDLEDGVWIVEIEAEADRPAPFRDVRRVVLKAGTLQ